MNKLTVVYIFTVFMMTGCAGGMIKREDVAKDLGKIVAQGDCELACAALKAYIQEKLVEK